MFCCVWLMLHCIFICVINTLNNHIDSGSVARSLFPFWTWLRRSYMPCLTSSSCAALRSRCTKSLVTQADSRTPRSEPVLQPTALHASNTSEGDGTIRSICVIFGLPPRTGWELLSFGLLRSQHRLFGTTYRLHFRRSRIFLHVCTVHQWRLKHFIIQRMHKYIICRYN